MEIVVLFNDVAGTSGSNMVGTDVISEEEATFHDKDEMHDTQRSRVQRVSWKEDHHREGVQQGYHVFDGGITAASSRFQQRERATNVELRLR